MKELINQITDFSFPGLFVTTIVMLLYVYNKNKKKSLIDLYGLLSKTFLNDYKEITRKRAGKVGPLYYIFFFFVFLSFISILSSLFYVI